MRKEALTYVKSKTYDVLHNKMYPDNEAVKRSPEEIERLIKQGHIVEWRESNKAMELNIDLFNNILLPLLVDEDANVVTDIVDNGDAILFVETKSEPVPVATVIQSSPEKDYILPDEVKPVEPKVEEPKLEEPKLEEPKLEEPVIEETVEEIVEEIVEEKQEEEEEFIEETVEENKNEEVIITTETEEIVEETPIPVIVND